MSSPASQSRFARFKSRFKKASVDVQMLNLRARDLTAAPSITRRHTSASPPGLLPSRFAPLDSELAFADG